MEDKRILYVSSEVVPYLAENEVSLMSYDVPKMINDQGGQIRIFMPRYGNINERRHQLHEVIRLSGMNLVVNDLDMPLIIKESRFILLIMTNISNAKPLLAMRMGYCILIMMSALFSLPKA